MSNADLCGKPANLAGVCYQVERCGAQQQNPKFQRDRDRVTELNILSSGDHPPFTIEDETDGER